MSDILRPKSVPVDRLSRRVEKYRAHHDDCGPRFELSNNGLIEQQKQDTLLLRQRYLESKAKKSSKKSDKANKQQQQQQQQQQHGDGTSSSSKLHKRQYEEIDLVSAGGAENFEPPSKMAHHGIGSNGSVHVPNSFKHSQGHQSQHQSQKGHGHSGSNQSKNEALTKFSLEIVHKVELTSGGGSNSLQNVTVKTNTNLKSGGRGNSSPANHNNHSGQSPVSISIPTSSSTSSSASYTSSNMVNIELKQDQSMGQSSGFDDLDQCAAALEKDAANSNGSIIASLMMGLVGDGTGEGMIPSDTLKDLISEISDLNPDFMGDFDFEEDRSDLANLGLSGLNSSNSTNHSNMLESNNMAGVFVANSHGYGHGHLSNISHTPPVAPVTPTATTTNSSPRLSHMKHETSDHPNSGYQNTVDNSCGNRGLSHCAGPSPAAASTASPLASQLNSHHPSQTPPYCSGSAMFDSTSPSGAQGHPLPNSGSSTPNPNSYGPPTRVPTPSSGPGSNSHSSKSGSGNGSRIPYTSPNSLVHDSPAAQTLKQMAEQHQHKTQLGMTSYKPAPGSNPSPARSPFNGDSYCGGFNGNPGDFNSSTANGPNYPNPVASRTHPGVGGGNEMNIKQEQANVMFNSSQNFPSMEMNSVGGGGSSKRAPHSQSQQPQHKSSMVPPAMLSGPGPLNSPNPANRMTNPNVSANHMMQQQQQQQQLHPPLHPNKSFNHSTQSSVGGCHLGGPSANLSASHMANSQMPQFMGRPQQQQNTSICPSATSNFSPTSHHNAYNHSQQPNAQNHPSIQMSQSQQISMTHSSNSSGSLQVTGSGSQQLGMNSSDLKGTNVLAMQQQQQNMSYYQNVPSHPSQQMHSSSAGVVDSNGSFLQNPMSSQSVSNNPPNGGSQQGQTINFTQQHLRMSTGTGGVAPGANNMNRMMGVVPPNNVQGPPQPGPVNPNAMNARMPIAPRMTSVPGMNEMGMNQQRSTMDIQQQRMMIRQQQQQMRSQAMQQQQVGMMMRPPTQADYKPEMMPNSQTMVGQNPSQAVMMSRFNPGGSGPGRPAMIPNQQMSGGHRLSQQQQQQNHMYQQHQQQQLQQVQAIGAGGMPQHMSNINMNNMNMPMRRLPSYHSNVSPNPGQISGNINPGSRNPMMSTGQSQPQPNMNSIGGMSGIPQQEWMAMQHESQRNFNMQQQQQQSIRSNASASGYHQGMAMQMSQQQHSMGQMPMGGNVGINPGMMPGNSGMSSMSYAQQQQQHVSMSGNSGNGNNMFSQPMNIKMSQSQNMCLGSNFAMRNGAGGMAISNSSTGSGGTLIQSTPVLHSAPSQTNHHHPQTNPALKNELNNQNDFSFDLLENITSGDSTSFGCETDFLSSYEANSNYQQILDSL